MSLVAQCRLLKSCRRIIGFKSLTHFEEELSKYVHTNTPLPCVCVFVSLLILLFAKKMKRLRNVTQCQAFCRRRRRRGRWTVIIVRPTVLFKFQLN